MKFEDLYMPVGDGISDDTKCLQKWADIRGYLPIKGSKGFNFKITKAIVFNTSPYFQKL